MPFWGTKTAEIKGPKPKWTTGEPYDILGNDHVTHVQAKIDESGLQNEYEIVVAKPHQLQIDYDVPALPPQFEKALDILTQAFCRTREFLIYRVTKSRHGNLHVMIDLPELISNTERIAWQSIFGSDPTREALSLMSVRRNIANPTLLIERRNSAPFITGAKVLEEPKGRKFRDTSTASD